MGCYTAESKISIKFNFRRIVNTESTDTYLTAITFYGDDQ